MADDGVKLNRLRIALSNECKQVRYKALNELKKYIADENSEFDFPSEKCLKLILQAFSDEAQVCRERAVEIVTSSISRRNTVSDELCLMITSFVKEMLGGGIVKEFSEEVRCSLLKLLSLVVSVNHECAGSFVPDIMSVYLNCMSDSCPEVIMRGFEVLRTFIENYPNSVHEYADNVVESLESYTKHKHSRLRTESVNSLKIILQYCGKETVFRICSLLGGCLSDRSAGVRVSILRAVSHSMLALPCKYSYACCMVPMILSLLNDESEDCRKEAFILWNKIGSNYLNDIKKSAEQETEYVPREIVTSELDADKFNQGCRVLVQKEMAAFLPAIMTELDDWRADVRTKSAELLKTTVMFAGLSVIPFLDTLLPVMLKRCRDEEKIVSKHVIEAAEIIGKVVPIAVYWRMIKAYMVNGCTLNHLIVLSSLLKFSTDDEIFEVMNDAAFFFNNIQPRGLDDAAFQKSLLRVFSMLLLRCEGDILDTNVSYNVYVILLTTMMFAEHSNQVKVLDSFETLSLATGFQSTTTLNEYFIPKLYERFLKSCPIWQTNSADFKIFIVSLRWFSDDVFQYVPDALVRILNVVLHPEFCREVRFRSLLVIAEVIECGNVNFCKYDNAMEKFISGPLKQLLIWRSGKVAEVTRNTALTIFNLYVERLSTVSITFLNEFAPVLVYLCEDNYEETRLGVLHSFALCYNRLPKKRKLDSALIQTFTEHQIVIPIQKFESRLDAVWKQKSRRCIVVLPVHIAVAGRLEDKSDVVRLLAISTLKEIFLNISSVEMEAAYGLDNFSKIMEPLFVMSSDKNIRIRNELQGLLKNPIVMNFLSKFCCK